MGFRIENMAFIRTKKIKGHYYYLVENQWDPIKKIYSTNHEILSNSKNIHISDIPKEHLDNCR
jgi:hypothetical protein